MLPRLLKKQRLTVLGLNSGTSADSVDLAAVRVDRSNNRYRARVLDGATRKLPARLRTLLLGAADSETFKLDHLVYLEQALGMFFGDAARRFVSRLAKRSIKVDLIASHGQTVRHCPGVVNYAGTRVRGTLQIGSLEQIAARTGCVTVGDFRQADIALGNEGAPITVAAMQRLFGDKRESRAVVNIGGMANYFYFPKGARRSVQAADCGPGNSLCDLLAQTLYNEPFDRGGRRALQGKASQRLLSLLLADPFYIAPIVSTGRETFGPKMFERMIAFGKDFKLPPEDLMATAAELTVIGIAEGGWLLIDENPTIRNLYLTGGGVRNKFFTQRLARVIDSASVTSIKKLGFDPGLVEASAYAVMGEACLRGETMPSGFGNDKTGRPRVWPVSGVIVQPPQAAKAKQRVR
jgi:anhydro-N-acetylmuramic acid kinase